MSSNTSVSQIVRSSMEAIAYQGSTSGLFRDLTAAFQTCIDNSIKDQKSFMALNMGEIVRMHTGMAIQFKLDPEVGLVNACAMPILLDPNSPLLQLYKDLGYAFALDAYTTTHEKILPLTNSLRGSIDLKRGRVTGVLTKIPTDIMIGSGLWLTARLTAEECAAACIHEIGHVFTYFESLLWATTTNITLTSAKRDINRMPDGDMRIKLVFEVAQALQVKIDKAERLADPKLSDSEFQAIFLAAMGSERARTGAGSGNYDLRSSEVVADQFAARHGAGRQIISGLYKMHKQVNDPVTRPVWLHYFGEVRKLLATTGVVAFLFAANPIAGVIAIAMVGLSALAYVSGANPELKIYDDPQERFARIRKDLVQSLKTIRFDPKERAVLLRDIEEIDEIIKTIHNKRTLMNMLWIYVSGERRRQFNQMKFEQELESLVNNDVFVNAAKLQTLNA